MKPSKLCTIKSHDKNKDLLWRTSVLTASELKDVESFASFVKKDSNGVPRESTYYLGKLPKLVAQTMKDLSPQNSVTIRSIHVYEILSEEKVL